MPAAEHWVVRSDAVEATLNALGGMLAPAWFTLPDGRRVAPFKVSDWSGRVEAEALPPVMRYLRGEFACVPFGAPQPPPSATEAWRSLFEADPNFSDTHGYCANHEWSLVDRSEERVTASIEYPDGHPLARVEKTVTAGDALDVELRVFARHPTRVSVGVHPVLDIGDPPGGAELDTVFRFGRTFPGDYAPGISRFAPDARFERLDAVPLRDGAPVDIARLPLSFPAEEVVQLCGTDGRLRLTRADPGYVLDFTWDAGAFPSLLLGIANGGRTQAPYDGKWRALYAEPVAAAFGMGSSIGANPENPIAREGVRTWVDLDPSRPWATAYRFAVHPFSTAED